MATHVPRRRKRKHPGRPTKARPAAIQHSPEPGSTARPSWRALLDKWASALPPLAKVFSALASIVMSITGHPPPK